MLNDSKIARKLVYWDTGIKANRARDYISAQVQLRSADLNGGIDTAAENLKKVGKISEWLKRAGWVGVVIEGGTTYLKASDAYSKGDTKGGNIEVGKGTGSIVGGLAGGALAGAVVGYLVFGVVTGGVGLVVVGVAAAAAGYGSGKVGEAVGERGAKKFNEVAF